MADFHIVGFFRSLRVNLNYLKLRKNFEQGKQIIAKFRTMKAIIFKYMFAAGFLTATTAAFPQCEILNRVSPDGSMQYYMEPVNFYWTSAKSLQGCIVTDKESYFLELHPVPFPEKPQGSKLKKDLTLQLSDGNVYALQHFDTRYASNDTVMEMLYLINKKDMEALLNFEVIEARIDMMGEEGIRAYLFKLHKSALKEQLACFLQEAEKKKK
jgi:hypothetical protein